MKSMLDDDKKFDDEKYYKEVKEGKHDKDLREMLRVELKKGNEKGYDVFEQALKGYKSGSELAKARLDRARIIMKQEQDRDIRLLNSDEQNFLQQMEIFMDDPNKREEKYTGGKTMNILDDDKKRMNYSNGEYVPTTPQKRYDSFINQDIKYLKELGDDYYNSGSSGMFKRAKQAMGDFGQGERLLNDLRKVRREMGDDRSDDDLLKMINTQFKDSGLNYTVSSSFIKRDKKAEGKLVGNQKEIDANNDGKITGDDFKLLQKAEGGSMDDQMLMVMTPPMESNMESDDDMEDNYTKFIMEEALSEEEEDMLTSKLEQDEELSMLFDKIIDVAQEFAGSGPVEGPGSGVSDSIPARLSDGEFVFTAKAVEEIGEDALMSMMKDAEASADERQQAALGGMLGMEEKMKEDQFGNPMESDIADDEIRKGMLSTNPRLK